MKKSYLLLLTAVALLSGACSKDEAITEHPNEASIAPQIIATVEQGDVKLKSGVIEGNDYTTGEKFYWSNGDATTVFFRNTSMTHPNEYKKAEYLASVAGGVQSNSCTFNISQSESIDNGQYTVYGFFPTSAWAMDPQYSNFLAANIPAYQIQTQTNSTHLGAYMLMKAEKSVTVNGNNPISLSYKQLSSVIRFAVWNNSSYNNLKLTNINARLSSGKAVFATNAKLDDIEAKSVTISNNSKVPELTLQLTGDAQNFANKDGKKQCEGYMAILPTETGTFESTDNLIVELSFTDGANRYFVTKTYNIGTDLAFLSAGIEGGKSYYFQLKVENSELVPIIGTSYAVGDYWPNSSNPEGIVFWVKPGRYGTQGKVVGFRETYVPKWGPMNDELAVGVVGIRSLTNGLIATKSMIAKYKSSPTFSTDYPAFYYIYKTVNSGNENGTWYLPARDELKMLFAGYSGKTYENITEWNNNMPGYNSAECIAARMAFNTKITQKSGNAFGSAVNSVNWWYLSSTESTDIISFSLNLERGSYSTDEKTLDGNIRWIKNF